jgi:type I restriction-modification system DNA methylase subunit
VELPLYLGWQEKWDYLDFAHIPVGVLSEAYEHYMREHKPDQQRKESSYYTPRAIADLMVRGAFLALRRDGAAHQAKVLDPAAGAGVFLVSVFRQLVVERWLHDAKRPDTHTLRDILYGQIVGFDINEAALRFAALGLYLMSIELDPEPEPIEKLRFERNLRDIVLHALSNGAPQEIGSLGKKVSIEHVGHYDLVIGNPPWASATQLPDWSEVIDIVAHIAKERLPQDTTPPPLPNEGLDLPFVWRAMQWGKTAGQMAFALHGRL